MSFYNSITGKPIDGSAENAFAQMFTLIPDGTQAPAMIKAFELREPPEFNPFYQVTWKLVDGEFKSREVRQSIKAFDDSPEKRERALNMLVRLFNLCDFTPTHNNAPTNQDLVPLINKICGIKIQEWSITRPDGSVSEGNWVSEVHKADGEFHTITGVTPMKVNRTLDKIESALTRNKNNQIDLNDDIPF